MNEITKTQNKINEHRSFYTAVLQNFLAAFFGFVLARAGVQGVLAPFALSLVFSAPSHFLASSVLGSVVGYFIPNGQINPLKYIAALAAAVSIKYMLSCMRNFTHSRIVQCVFCFLSVLVTSLVINGLEPYNAAISICEAFLAAVVCYFLSLTVSFFKSNLPSPDSLTLCSIIISINLLLLGLFPLTLFDVSLGRVLASVFLLLSSRYGKTPTAAVCGVSVSVCLIMNSVSLKDCAVLFCIAGLVSGIFASLGKIACSLSYLLTFCLCSVLLGQNTAVPVLITEAIFGTAIFLILPKELSKKAAGLLSPFSVAVSDTGKTSAVSMRLSFAADALKSVSATVDNVAKELSKINCPDFDSITDSIKNEVCRECSLYKTCWENHTDKTIGHIAKMAGNIHTSGTVMPEEFKQGCLKAETFEDTFVKKYKRFLKCLDDEARLEQVRTAVANQFDSIGNMLTELGAEFENDEQYDTYLSDKVACSLREIGIIVNDCSCRVDKYKRMTLQIRVCEQSQTVFNRMYILRRIEDICERDFENPCIVKAKDQVLITLSEKAAYTLDTAAKQINSAKNTVCGDCYNCFFDGRGRYIMLLSDGMGSGGRAAVDGAMTTNILSRLIKAGFGWDSAFKILNSSMLFKSTDESLATVDAVCIDLFTGKTEFYKAGAAQSIVLRNSRCSIAKSSSLPAGILQGISLDSATVSLRKGDTVVMLSDGAVCDGTDWICAVMESFEGSAEQLCEKIAADALRRKLPEKNDDITVIAAVLHKAV